MNNNQDFPTEFLPELLASDLQISIPFPAFQICLSGHPSIHPSQKINFLNLYFPWITQGSSQVTFSEYCFGLPHGPEAAY